MLSNSTKPITIKNVCQQAVSGRHETHSKNVNQSKTIVKNKKDNKTKNKTKVNILRDIYGTKKYNKGTEVLKRIYVMVLRLFYYDYRIYVNRESTMSHNVSMCFMSIWKHFLLLWALEMVLLVILKTMEWIYVWWIFVRWFYGSCHTFTSKIIIHLTSGYGPPCMRKSIDSNHSGKITCEQIILHLN